MRKVIIGKDGRSETVDDYSEATAQAKLQRTRRELRDMLAGNTQFHTDNLGQAPKEEPPVDVNFDDFLGVCCTPGFDRYESIFGKRRYA